VKQCRKSLVVIIFVLRDEKNSGAPNPETMSGGFGWDDEKTQEPRPNHGVIGRGGSGPQIFFKLGRTYEKT